MQKKISTLQVITRDGKEKVYKNFLNFIPYTYDSLKAWTDSMIYDNPRTDKERKRNSTAEKELGWPLFVQTFYDIFIQDLKRKRYPTEDEYVNLYIKRHEQNVRKIIKENIQFNETEEQVFQEFKDRLKRAYPSFLRDSSSALALDKMGYSVLYNVGIDIYQHTDVVLLLDNIQYGIALYTSTDRAYIQRHRKLLETKMPKQFIKVECPLPMFTDDAYNNNKFVLYSEKDMEVLINRIRNKQYDIDLGY